MAPHPSAPVLRVTVRVPPHLADATMRRHPALSLADAVLHVISTTCSNLERTYATPELHLPAPKGGRGKRRYPDRSRDSRAVYLRLRDPARRVLLAHAGLRNLSLPAAVLWMLEVDRMGLCHTGGE